MICIVGVGFKPGSGDTTNTAGTDVVRELRKKGAEVVYCDRAVLDFSVDGVGVARVHAPIRATAALLLSGDPSVDLAEISRDVPIVVDAGGGRIMPGSRDKVMEL